eukprot:88954_1
MWWMSHIQKTYRLEFARIRCQSTISLPVLKSPQFRTMNRLLSYCTTHRMLSDMSSGREKFAVFVTGPVTDFCKKHYGTYGTMFRDALKENDEQWDLWEVQHGEFPSDEQLGQYSGIVITGSKYSAHETDVPWIAKLNEACRRVAENKDQRILGVCFGHQAVSNALGGRSGPVNWNVGLRRMKFNPGFSETFQNSSFTDPHLDIAVLHHDQVLDLPPTSKVLASYEGCPVAMYSVGTNVLCLQGHPEFDSRLLKDILRIRMDDKIIPKSVGDPGVKSLDESPQQEKLFQICRTFLKNGFGK